MNAKSKALSRWSKTRELGRTQYTWRFGVGYWGLTMAVFWLLMSTFLFGTKQYPVNIISAFTLFPAAGYMWGIMTWRINEKFYQNACRNSNELSGN